jgi:putative methyltransferase
MTRNVYLSQINNKFGGNKAFLPYSVGLLQAYAKAQPDLNESYKFSRPIFLRENPRNVAESLDKPDVLGISCYVWNWEWNNELAKEIRGQHPDSLIVLGGPQVPNRSEGFFEEHPYIDILVHGEGETIFSDILREHLKPNPNYLRIPGITLNQGGISVKTLQRPRLTENEFPPSPYLTGEFEDILREYPDLEFHATSETHRGCPFSCTYCDWGSSIFTKVRPFPDERIKSEYDWISAHGIKMIYNADANFGILLRDETLTDYLISLKEKTGYPKQLRANWTKNTHGRIFNVAKKLNRAGMDLGVTLSLQSLDPHTLENIRRKNIKFDNFTDLVQRYEQEKIPTYTEMILALPGETYDSFSNGLETLLEGGQHSGINVYLCTLLPNSEMSTQEYRNKYKIRSVHSPILQNHATPGKDPITEYSDMVVATESMPPQDFRKSFLFSWAVQTFHSLGLARDIANYLKSQGVLYRKFYEELLSANPDTLIGQRVAGANRCLDRGLNGGEWGEIDLRYGPIIWPIEEKSFLDIVTRDVKLFYTQLEKIVNHFISPFPKDVIQKQMLRMRTPNEFGGDIQEYAKKVVWFGRKFGFFLKD